jgi:hypothetical protein
MNVIIRGGFIALSLATGVAPFASAAPFCTSQQLAISQPAPEDATHALADRTNPGEPAATPGASDRATAGSFRMPGQAFAIQRSNDFTLMHGSNG